MQPDYDFIIIGAGAAGCVLAGNLSASGKHSVLLLEAGPDKANSFWVTTPLGYGHSMFNSRVNWMLQSEPDANLNGRRQYVPRGKVTGGSGSINAMVYMRGTPADYEEWAGQGNPGWGWDDVLASYKRMERHASGDAEWHGLDGPLEVTSRSPFSHPICRAFLQAGEELQLPRNENFNGASIEGVGYYHHSICANGKRMSSARAWLEPARKRANFTMVCDARVERLVLDGRRVTGVTYLKDGHRHEVKARRDIILSAGAIHSPQLLMVSGIGPGKALKSCGVEPLHDLPAVGQHLQDHVAWDIKYRSRVPTLNQDLHSKFGQLKAGIRYLLTGGGPLSTGTTHAGGFLKSSPKRPAPNLQLYFSPLSRDLVPGAPGRMGQPDPYAAFSMSVCNMRPKSRGAITIAGPGMDSAPAIQFNFLSDPDDLQELVEGAHLLRRLAAAPALNAIIEREYAPGPEVTSDKALEDDIRNRCYSIYHPSGSCRMGPDTAAAVVDARLKVHGLEGLRVADASIMPFVVSGNLNAPSMMIGQRASEIILADASA